MNILLVSTLKRSIGPTITASRSQIIYQLAKGMVERGHQVSVLGTGDSVVEGATIIPVIPIPFVSMPISENPFYQETGYLTEMTKMIIDLAPAFDIIHNNTYPEFINLLAASSITTPMITTIHAQATEDFDNVLSKFKGSYFVSISKAHKKGFPKTLVNKVIYNGIDTNLYAFQEKKDDYLLWVGRLGKAKDANGQFMDAKGIKWAIKLAHETGERLKLGGNVEDMAFFDEEVKPYLNDKIEWVGEVSSEQSLSQKEVAVLMQGAKAFLMTINWQEPFGLVMAEAMSCGTPIIAFKRGSVPELVINGKTGFIVDPKKGIEGLKKALSRIDTINPQTCREHVVKNFSIDSMITRYEAAYNSLHTK